MQVKVLFFGQLRDIVGRGEEAVELAEGASVADLLTHYRRTHPRLQDFRSSLAVSVNQEYAEVSAPLHHGDEVALLPPVSGGSAEEWIRLTRGVIRPEEFLPQLKAPADGAVVTFDGIVRNHSGGKQTLYLDYEAYEPMALKKMREIAAEMRSRYPVDSVAIVHRLGRLAIGETTMFIAVSAAHRAAAFDACRYALERLKRTVPIWKKEYFADGAVWVEGEVPACAEAATTEPNR
ncbi:MAG: molybdopterin converting factor subunit 1 [Terriglobia bacterium]